MKLFSTLLFLAAITTVGFGQSMNTSTSMALPNVVADDAESTTIVEAEFDEEITVDMVFDKIALIESLVFTKEELREKNQKHMKEETELVYFGNVK
jgi:hypothetical protein